jgi:hypothetical protein
MNGMDTPVRPGIAESLKELHKTQDALKEHLVQLRVRLTPVLMKNDRLEVAPTPPRDSVESPILAEIDQMRSQMSEVIGFVSSILNDLQI